MKYLTMIEITKQEHTAVVTMNHGKVNAMDLEFCLELDNQLQKLQDSSDSKAVVITAPEKVFSAGVDLVRLIEEDENYLDEFLPSLTNLFKTAFNFPKPLIARVNGHAIAGGCVLACACDYRVIHPRARIGIPELRVGVPFPTSGLEIMRFTAVPHSFRQIVNNGKTFAGDDAIAAGLGDELSTPEDSLDVSLKIASELSQIPHSVFAHTKRHVRSIATDRIKSGEEAFEPTINRMWRDAEVREAVHAYVERQLKKKV